MLAHVQIGSAPAACPPRGVPLCAQIRVVPRSCAHGQSFHEHLAASNASRAYPPPSGVPAFDLSLASENAAYRDARSQPRPPARPGRLIDVVA